MNIDVILKALERNTGAFPRQAVQAAIAQRDEITPHLLAIVERATREIDRIVADETYLAHLYAFYLLAQFRERRASPLIVDFFSIPGKATMQVTGDFVTESLGAVLASVSGGDMAPMQSLVENPALNEYVRAAALRGLVCLVAEGVKARQEIIDYFRTLYRGGLERTYSFVWDALLSCSTEIYPEELLPDIRQSYTDDLIDESHIDLEWVEKVMAEGQEVTLDWLQQDRHAHFIDDTIAEMHGWACFEPPPPPPPRSETRHPASAKIGRNAPCPCGSGLKYKYCCGKKRQETN